MTERQGIEIDYCPNCRGVWLDKGELDKIIEKSIQQQEPDQTQQNQKYKPPYIQSEGNRYSKHDNYGKHGGRGFLGKLFDF
jgi:Zn-finger nucleic acid-binding protein